MKANTNKKHAWKVQDTDVDGTPSIMSARLDDNYEIALYKAGKQRSGPWLVTLFNIFENREEKRADIPPEKIPDEDPWPVAQGLAIEEIISTLKSRRSYVNELIRTARTMKTGTDVLIPGKTLDNQID